jgi:hypothetical protein
LQILTLPLNGPKLRVRQIKLKIIGIKNLESKGVAI